MNYMDRNHHRWKEIRYFRLIDKENLREKACLVLDLGVLHIGLKLYVGFEYMDKIHKAVWGDREWSKQTRGGSKMPGTSVIKLRTSEWKCGDSEPDDGGRRGS